MSEFLAEARILVRPDTSKFRAELAAQLAVATKGVVVPVTVVPSSTGAAATGFARLSAVQNEIRRGAEETSGAMKTLDRDVNRTTQRLGQFRSGAVASLASLTGLRGAVLAASGPFLAAAVGATAFLKSLQAFADFEQELNVFAATTEATGAQMEKVSDLARELGADLTLPAVSATDAAVAMTELSKAGLSVEEAMGGARGVLQLSTAAGISVGEAAQFAANELNAFGLAGDQAVKVADVLANAANAAQGSISDFGLAFKQSAAVANLVGFTLEDTAAQLTILARAGLQGSDAGTSLRVALLRLINPTKAAAVIIKDLGINLRDAAGNIRPDVFVQFGEAARRLTPAMRDAAFATVFGADGIRTVSIAAEAGRDALAEATIEIGETGTAAELAEARTAGFGGQLEGLQSTAATTAVSLGEISTVLAGPLVFGLTGVANLLNQVLEPFAELIRLSKQKLGLGFDPTTQSAADLLTRLREVRAAYEGLSQTSGIGEEAIQNAIKDTIRALEAQRSTLKALGQDTTGITALITSLENELRAGAAGVVSALTPAEQAAKDLRELIKSAAADGIDTTALEASLRRMEEGFAALALEGKFAREFGDAFRDAAGGVDALTAALARLTREAAASSDALLKAQNEGASPQRQIEILRGQEQTQRDIIENLKANGIQAGDPSAIRAARQEIESIQGQIESLQAGIVADQKAAASSAEKSAKDAQEDRDDQFQAIAEMFEGRQGGIADAIARAGIAGNVEAQIRLNKALIASLQKERAALLERLRTLKVSADVRKKIMAQIDAAIEDAQQDILRAQQTQAEGLQKLLTTKIDIRIRIAQARDDVAAEIAARTAKVQIITKELVRLKNAGKKNTVAWLELKAQQAEEIAAINDLANQAKTEGQSGQTAQQFFFEQLQAQQGFAANLLGNLIPRDMTAGLVGVPSPAALPQVGAGIGAAAGAAQGRARTGPTSGQVSTTNDILLRILNELKTVNKDGSAPEAAYNRKLGTSIMDGGGGNLNVM